MLPRNSKGIVPIKRRVFNEEEATSIAIWIEEVIDEDLEFPEDLSASLRSGIDLCRVINVIQPGTFNEIYQGGDPVGHENNLRAYLDACYHFGMSTYDLFEPQDLYNNGDMQRILSNIVALARMCVSNGVKVPKLEIDDRCQRSDCCNKLDVLLGEVGSLKRNFKAKEEDNRELRQENDDFHDKLARQEDQVMSLRAAVQLLESTNAELVEKNQLLDTELRTIKKQLEDLQHREQAHLPSISEEPTIGIQDDNRKTPTEDIEAKEKKKKKDKKRTGSADLKGDAKEEMRKFIHKEKKELMKQEKARRKQEEKMEQEDNQQDSPSIQARITKGFRSLTLKKPKEKSKSDDRPMLEKGGQSGSLNSIVVSEGLQRQSSLESIKSTPRAPGSGSFLRRERSFTEGAKLAKPTKDTSKPLHASEYPLTPRNAIVT